jgi:hypothetical protein
VTVLDLALEFPTVVFSIGLGVVLVYWLFVVLGALDIDLFGGDADVSGAGKAIGDAIGGAKGAGEGVKDVVVTSGGIWSGLGLGKVPITVSVSAVLFVCWCLSLLASQYLVPALGDAAWAQAVVLPASLAVGLPISGLLVRPLGRVFELREGKSNRDYVGHVCTITTGRVDNDFGQATVEDGGTVLVIAVRCDRGSVLARGDRALIIDFDRQRHAYVVEPVTDMLPPDAADDSA